jgi:hypothetical protein
MGQFLGAPRSHSHDQTGAAMRTIDMSPWTYFVIVSPFVIVFFESETCNIFFDFAFFEKFLFQISVLTDAIYLNLRFLARSMVKAPFGTLVWAEFRHLENSFFLSLSRTATILCLFQDLELFCLGVFVLYS